MHQLISRTAHLHVAMHDVIALEVVETCKHLLRDTENLRHGEPAPPLKKTRDIKVHKTKHHVKSAILRCLHNCKKRKSRGCVHNIQSQKLIVCVR